jgi:hypothetical protein
MVCLMSLNFPWFVLAPKVLQLCINHFVLVLCRSMWVIEACHFFLVPSWSSSTPFYPSKVLWAREHAPTLCFFVFFSLGLIFESLKELGARHIWTPYINVAYIVSHVTECHVQLVLCNYTNLQLHVSHAIEF